MAIRRTTVAAEHDDLAILEGEARKRVKKDIIQRADIYVASPNGKARQIKLIRLFHVQGISP